MASLELECKIVQKLGVQSGKSAKGEWSKQEVVFEYQEGNFPSKVCMSVWGADKVRDLEGFRIGENVKVYFNLSSREYQGKWYTDIRIWRMEHAAAAAVQTSSQAPRQTQTPQYNSAPMPGLEDYSSPDSDGSGSDVMEDLPF